MPFNIENLRKLKRTSIGHNTITSVSLTSINCTSAEDLQQLFNFIAQGIDIVGGIQQLAFARFPPTIKLDRSSLDQLIAKTQNLHEQ